MGALLPPKTWRLLLEEPMTIQLVISSTPVIQTSDPMYESMKEEIFGPVLTVYVYDDSAPNYWEDVMELVDKTTPYGLTGAVFAKDRTALTSVTSRLRHAMGNLYLNDKCTGAVVGEQPFG